MVSNYLMTNSPANGNDPPPTPQRVPTLLVVEDEDNPGAVIRRLLQGEGYAEAL
jgi:hypothetical protein